MDNPSLQAIYNYRSVSDRIGTSGMPTEDQLADIARAGFEVVINLDQLDSRHALPDERGSVEALGLTYLQIPVVWDHPTHENLAEFREAMAKYADRRAFVHCVANMRGLDIHGALPGSRSGLVPGRCAEERPLALEAQRHLAAVHRD